MIMILTGLFTARFFSELMRVPENILGAFIITFCLIGAFALRNDMADVWFMAIFGILGYFMRRYALPIPPLILGVILGPLAESYFMTTMISEGNDWTVFIRRPVSGCLLLVAVILLIMPVFRRVWNKSRPSGGTNEPID
jgi:putative tricarboxylic transport membrane protein